MINQQNALSVAQLKEHTCHSKCLSWSAIAAGALVAIGLMFLINLFILSMGLTVVTTTQQGVMTLALGAFLAMLIGTIACMFFAGWVSGYLARTHCVNQHFGALYGLITWSLAILITIICATQTSHFVFSRYNALSQPTAALSNVLPAQEVSAIMRTAAGVVNKDGEKTVVNDKVENKVIGISLFLMFITFFVGAIASCFGGYCGLKPRRDSYEANRIPPAKIK